MAEVKTAANSKTANTGMVIPFLISLDLPIVFHRINPPST